MNQTYNYRTKNGQGKFYLPEQLFSTSPWIDIRLPEEAMTYLWSIINNPDTVYASTDSVYAARTLAGNISKSLYVQDKDNFFYNKYLKELSEHRFYQDWNNYYDIVVTESKPPVVFELKRLWVNYQKQYEFNPPHRHDGYFSFVVFMKIPTHWKEQHALPASVSAESPCASDFQFLGPMDGSPNILQNQNIPLCPDDEGRMLFFPAWLSHQVFPFYGTEEERITIAGNIVEVKPEQEELSTHEEDKKMLHHYELDLEQLQRKVKLLTDKMQYEDMTEEEYQKFLKIQHNKTIT